MKRAVSILLVLTLLFTNAMALSDEQTASVPDILGDVFMDGAVGNDDALVILQAITQKVLLTPQEERLADANGDGEITVNDALAIMQFANGKIGELPGAEAFYSSALYPSEPDVGSFYKPAYTAVYSVKTEAENGQYPNTCHLVYHDDRTVVGYTSADNRYLYPLSVEREGYYLLTYCISAIADVSLTLRVDTLDRATLHPENTGDWQAYVANHSAEPLYLSPGDHVIAFEQHDGGMNFDWFSLTYLAEGSPDQLPDDRQLSADFTNTVLQAGYRLPLTISGLSDTDKIERYVWYIQDEFTATTDLMAATKLTVMDMGAVEVWPVVNIDNKTYYLHTQSDFSLPVVDPLPVITINTENAADITSKEEYIDASMAVTADGVAAEQLYSGGIEIKGRGNATWAYPKKPYRIKLNKKADLFGMGANKHWVLLANYRDRAFSRTALAFDLSEHMGLPTPQSVFVKVVLNGQDIGVYQLCEQIRVGETRIDIMDWEDEVENEEDLSSLTSANGYDITGGFLIELNGYYDEISQFKTEHNVPLTVKSPEYLNTNSEMFNYLVEYIQDFEDAVFSETFINDKGQHYSDLFEVEDLVNYWVVNEFLGNLDSGRWSSTYMYKDIGGDKFHMGPVWDFDSSIGNYHGHHTQCPANQWVKGRQGTWYTQLYRDRTFVEKLYNRYWENRDYLESLIDKAKDYYLALYPEAMADHEYWDIPTTYQYDTQVVVDWLEDRLAFMDEQFATVDTAYASLNK